MGVEQVNLDGLWFSQDKNRMPRDRAQQITSRAHRSLSEPLLFISSQKLFQSGIDQTARNSRLF
ncbi:MAG: hypothetical protein DMG05_02640 [Acidobacteria bacterium]|nr:MAG: hypothetical protein DMG05_02640 [Acidobacteriota bacterium]